MIGLKADFKKFARKIEKLVRQVADLSPVARDFGGFVTRRIKTEMPAQEEPAAAGQPPASHHGGRGLRGSVTNNVLDVGVEIGTPLVYGAIQHFGGLVRRKNAGALTIPIDKKARGKRARDFAGLFRIPAKRGAPPEDRGILAIRTGVGRDAAGKFSRTASGGKNIKPLFALRTKVTIKPHPWLEITGEDAEYLVVALERQVYKEVFLHG